MLASRGFFNLLLVWGESARFMTDVTGRDASARDSIFFSNVLPLWYFVVEAVEPLTGLLAWIQSVESVDFVDPFKWTLLAFV